MALRVVCDTVVGDGSGSTEKIDAWQLCGEAKDLLGLFRKVPSPRDQNEGVGINMENMKIMTVFLWMSR